MANDTYKRQQYYAPAALGLNAVTLAAERTSNLIDITGRSELAIYVNYTYNAATRVDVNVDISPDQPTTDVAPSNWYMTFSQDIAAGVATSNELDVQNAISAASEKYYFNLTELNGFHARVRISSTGGGASDLATVTVITK